MLRHEWGPLLRSIASIDRSASDHAADAAPLFPGMARGSDCDDMPHPNHPPLLLAFAPQKNC